MASPTPLPHRRIRQFGNVIAEIPGPPPTPEPRIEDLPEDILDALTRPSPSTPEEKAEAQPQPAPLRALPDPVILTSTSTPDFFLPGSSPADRQALPAPALAALYQDRTPESEVAWLKKIGLRSPEKVVWDILARLPLILRSSLPPDLRQHLVFHLRDRFQDEPYLLRAVRAMNTWPRHVSPSRKYRTLCAVFAFEYLHSQLGKSAGELRNGRDAGNGS